MRKTSNPLVIAAFLLVVAGILVAKGLHVDVNDGSWKVIAYSVAVVGVLIAVIRRIKWKRATGGNDPQNPKTYFNSLLLDAVYGFDRNGQRFIIDGLPAHMTAVRLPVGVPGAPTYAVFWKMTGSINGYLLLQRRTQKPWLGIERELESIEFNKDTTVYASRRDLPFKVLAPNFMDWFLRVPTPPALFLKDSDARMYFMPPFVPDERDLPMIAQAVAQAIEHSGVLE